jgi:transcriptional regulator with XRE-family HTH domain
LLERRQRAKLTQRELAARIGWDQKIISNLERGSKRLTVLELIEIARALDFDLAAALRRVEKVAKGDHVVSVSRVLACTLCKSL